MKFHDLSRRTAFRVAVIFGGLFLVTVAVIFAVLYQSITDEIEARLKSHILEVRNTLVDVNKKDGFDGLRAVLKDKAAPSSDDEAIYELTDNDGRFVCGNVKLDQRFEGWKNLEWETLQFKSAGDKFEGTDTILALWTPIEGGYLLVGDGNGDIEETQALLLDGLGWGLALTLFSALSGGVWLGLRAQRRIDNLETALTAVSRGELSARIPLLSSGDDLDRVAVRINSTLDHLQDAVATLGQVSTDIAHDLKTPIGRISQRLESVRRSATTVEAYREVIDEVRDELGGVVATFEALLRIAQIEGGARKVRFTAVDLKDILVRVVEAYGYVGEETNHRIVADLTTAEPVKVSGDRDLLTQLFANIVENSIRHCPSGTIVNVGLRVTSDAAEVTVKDNGPGIPASERDRVFRRLYRLEKSRTTTGSGLGLSLVAAITELHDAKIELGDNHPGLIVVLRFPMPNF